MSAPELEPLASPLVCIHTTNVAKPTKKTATKKNRKPTPGQFPSQTYEARKDRGHRTISLSMSDEALEQLDEHAAKQGVSRSEMVALMAAERPAK